MVNFSTGGRGCKVSKLLVLGCGFDKSYTYSIFFSKNERSMCCDNCLMYTGSNLFITDSKGTGISVRIIDVSVLER